MLRRVFDHVTIRVADRAASRAFYEVLLGAPTHAGGDFDEWDDFSLAADGPVTRSLHVGFVARSRSDVDERWQRAIDAGYRSDGEPGPRPQYTPDYYGGFLLDPDGNSAEVVSHGEPRTNRIDHLWIGVSDLSAAKRFWATVAPVLGIRIEHERETRFHVTGPDGSFALVADGRPPTEHVHLAFPVDDDAAVAGFHALATAAGYDDNGGPGERPQYHRGYVAAFVLDPDGNNIEAVNHHRGRTAS
jgi:catechol 2,3-dioxygenase-like lactoylglutathione lyase family enzyme